MTRVYGRGPGLASGPTIYHLLRDECVDLIPADHHHCYHPLKAHVAPDHFVEGAGKQGRLRGRLRGHAPTSSPH